MHDPGIPMPESKDQISLISLAAVFLLTLMPDALTQTALFYAKELLLLLKKNKGSVIIYPSYAGDLGPHVFQTYFC